MSARRQLKDRVVEVCRSSDRAEFDLMIRTYSPAKLVNPLFACLCHTEDAVRWSAIELFGIVVGELVRDDIEKGRVIMRRCLWMLNDESGGVGWGVPEAMATAMAGNRRLAGEYCHMVISYALDDGPEPFQHGNFLELPRLQEGVLWALCRLADAFPDLLAPRLHDRFLIPYFASSSATVRGLACMLCGMLGLFQYTSQLRSLTTDESRITIYWQKEFHEYSLMELAGRSMEAVASTSQVCGEISPAGSFM
jgi:hypothetical protein